MQQHRSQQRKLTSAARSTRGNIISPFARGSPLWLLLWRDFELHLPDLNWRRETQRVESTSLRDSSLTLPFGYCSLTSSHPKVPGFEYRLDYGGQVHKHLFVLWIGSSICSTSPNSMYSTCTLFLHYISKDSPTLPSLPVQSSF